MWPDEHVKKTKTYESIVDRNFNESRGSIWVVAGVFEFEEQFLGIDQAVEAGEASAIPAGVGRNSACIESDRRFNIFRMILAKVTTAAGTIEEPASAACARFSRINRR